MRSGPESFSAHSFQLLVLTLQDLLVSCSSFRMNLLPVHKLSILHSRAGANLPVVQLRNGDHRHWLEIAFISWAKYSYVAFFYFPGHCIKTQTFKNCSQFGSRIYMLLQNIISIPLGSLEMKGLFGLDFDFFEVIRTPAPSPSLFSVLVTWFCCREFALCLRGLGLLKLPTS